MKIYRVIGLMSGTSLDAIDAALLQTDGEGHIVREAFVSIPYDEELREEVRSCFGQRNAEEVQGTEGLLTAAHAGAVYELLEKANVKREDVDLIGFHGQTISHAPDQGHTCQIGDGRMLSKITGIKVVNDFRTDDVKAGGQGAPLVPVYHQALSADIKGEGPVVFVNIGGVANVTYVGKNKELIAFDTGPGNALIDDWILEKIGENYDEDGKLAFSGKVDEKILSKLLSHPFFSESVPKSLDRNCFISDIAKNLSLEDGAATLAAFTVHSILKSVDYFPEQPKQWIISGGGRNNLFLIESLREKLSVPVKRIDSLGLDGDAIEAEAFAYLAVRSVRGLPISFPTTTGVKKALTGGKLSA